MTDNATATTASRLREVADEMERSPDEGFREFEWAIPQSPFVINEDGWTELCRRVGDPVYTVRRRPRTITIAGIEIPEPMREPPPLGTRYWCADVVFGVYATEWDGIRDEYRWLRRGLCHCTKRAAEEHVRALILASGGEVE